MPIASSRNSVPPATIVAHVMGLASVFTGIYLATLTRFYIYTGRTTHPYLGLGIALAAIGICVLGVAQATAKRNLRK